MFADRSFKIIRLSVFLNKMDYIEELSEVIDISVDDNISCLKLLNEFNTKCGEKINIFQSNVRSLSKHFIDIEVLLKIYSNVFDILILTETWFCESLEFFNVEGYVAYYNESYINKADGVVIFVKSSLNHTNKIIEINGFKFMRISVDINKINISVTSVYRPHTFSRSNFLDCLEMYLFSFRSSNFEIFSGDTNINLHLDNDPHVDRYKNLLSEFGLKQCIKKSTRIEGGTESCIDHFFIKSSIPVENILPIVLNSKISDHCPVILNLKLAIKSLDSDLISSTNANKTKIIDYDKIKTLILLENWSYLENGNNIQAAFSLFNDKISSFIKSSTFTKTSKNKTKKKAWITGIIIDQIAHRDFLHRKYLNDKNNTVKLQQYKNIRNLVIGLIRKAKNDHYRVKINSATNLKDKWNITKEAVNMNKSKFKIKSIKNSHGIIVSDEYDLANEFNNFFVDVSEHLCTKIQNRDAHYSPKIKPLTDSFFFIPILPFDIEDTIATLKNTKSCGNDGISSSSY